MSRELVQTDRKLLEAFKHIKSSIAEIDDFSELLEFRSKAGGWEKAWQGYYRSSGFGLEQMFLGWEAKVRSERKMGEILENVMKQGQRSDLSHDVTSLDDLGVSKMQSSRFQQLAAIPEKSFEDKINELKGGFLEPTTKELLSILSEIRRSEEQEKLIKQSKGFKSTDIQIWHGNFVELSEKIKDNSIDLVLTDPPYPEEFLHLWESLFTVADRVLKPSKFLVCYANHQNLDKIFQLPNKLKYYWTFKLDFTLKPIIKGRNIIATWKPVLIFQKLPFKKLEKTMEDNIKFDYEERGLHDKNWGQTVPPFTYLLEKFSGPNDLVFEPFAGTGTTLVACKEMKRKCIGVEIEKKYVEITKGRLV